MNNSYLIEPIKDYVYQAGLYISKEKNISQQEARKLILSYIRKNSNIPIVKYYDKNNKGDNIIKNEKITDYLKDIYEKNEVIVPSFTSYVSPLKEKSIHSEFMNYNINKRKHYKKLLFKNKMAGNKELATLYDNYQKSFKSNNNSLSGAYGSSSTLLFNESAHYTLTSITRCVSSIGNAVTESLIASNNYFKDINSIYNFITSLATYTPKNILEIIDFYNLYQPTSLDIYNKLLESSSYYFDISLDKDNIIEFLDKFNNIEKAFIYYNKDLKVLRDKNPELMRKLLTDFITKRTNISSDYKDIMNKLSYKKYLEDFTLLTKYIHYKEIKGKDINFDNLINTELGDSLVSTLYNIDKVFEHYKKLFDCFLFTKVLPPNIAYIKEMVRKVIVLSDTDSTCASYDEWVKWYFGEYNLSDTSIPITELLTMFVSMVVDNDLKTFSTMMNVPRDRQDILKMKNEFYWSSFIYSDNNKHYFANKLIQEGNIFNESDLEIKGVHLIGSTATEHVRVEINKLMIDINNKLRNNIKLSLTEVCNKVIELENYIEDRILNNDISVFKKFNIKDKSAYALDETKSPYLHYTFYLNVIGNCEKPPYRAIKLPTTLSNKTSIEEYYTQVDEKFKNKLDKFLNKYNKTSYNTIYLPIKSVRNTGIPNELLKCVNINKVIMDNLKAIYLILSSLGIKLPEETTLREYLK